MLTKTLSAALAAAAISTAFAAPVHADPADNPCELAVTFLCQFMPIAPDLEHDIDLTVEQPPYDPAYPVDPAVPPPTLP